MNPQAQQEKRITRDQIKFIKTIQRRHQSEDEYREMLESRYNVDSCTKLTSLQASELIKLYTSWGFIRADKEETKKKGKPRKENRKQSVVIKLASASQHMKVTALQALTGWKSTRGFERWMERHFGFDRIRTGEDAFLVIEGLKKIFESKMKKRFGPQWWSLHHDDEHVRRYIKLHFPKG